MQGLIAWQVLLFKTNYTLLLDLGKGASRMQQFASKERQQRGMDGKQQMKMKRVD